VTATLEPLWLHHTHWGGFVSALFSSLHCGRFVVVYRLGVGGAPFPLPHKEYNFHLGKKHSLWQVCL
jgi:hypothetical protein